MPASPLSFDGLSAGPGSKLKVRGVVTGTPPAKIVWSWSVRFADGAAVAFAHPVPGDLSLIQFGLGSAGSYTVHVRLAGDGACTGEHTVQVPHAGARLASYRFRAIPPPPRGAASVRSGELPVQDVEVQVRGGAPSGGNRLVLSPGLLFLMAVVHQRTSEPLPSYLRITGETGIVVEGRTGGVTRPFLANLPHGMYRTLIVPDGDIAPVVMPPMTAAELAQVFRVKLSLDEGVAVEGSVHGADETPLAGSRVVLRAGMLSSTLGNADERGTFRVRARAGTFAGTVSPPVALGMMRAELPVTEGVVIPSDPAAAPRLAFRLQPYRSARLSLSLSGSPDSLGPGARVVIESMAPIADIATLSTGAATQALSARVHGQLVPDSDGQVVAANLPRGRYKATIYPAGGPDALDAVTTVDDIDLGEGAQAPRVIQLARRVTLRGTLLPDTLTAGTQIVAVDVDSLLPLAFTKQVTAGGAWEMPVNPARTYLLRALPVAGRHWARLTFGRIDVAATDQRIAPLNLQPALPFSGTVVDTTGATLSGVLLQVFCVAGSPACTDPDAPVAESVTTGDGYFQLMLPDPGVNP